MTDTGTHTRLIQALRDIDDFRRSIEVREDDILKNYLRPALERYVAETYHNFDGSPYRADQQEWAVNRLTWQYMRYENGNLYFEDNERDEYTVSSLWLTNPDRATQDYRDANEAKIAAAVAQFEERKRRAEQEERAKYEALKQKFEPATQVDSEPK